MLYCKVTWQGKVQKIWTDYMRARGRMIRVVWDGFFAWVDVDDVERVS